MTQKELKVNEVIKTEQIKEVLAAEKKGTVPDYKGDGVSVWINTDKNGKHYLAIQIMKNKPVHAFKYEKKQGGDSQ